MATKSFFFYSVCRPCMASTSRVPQTKHRPRGDTKPQTIKRAMIIFECLIWNGQLLGGYEAVVGSPMWLLSLQERVDGWEKHNCIGIVVLPRSRHSLKLASTKKCSHSKGSFQRGKLSRAETKQQLIFLPTHERAHKSRLRCNLQTLISSNSASCASEVKEPHRQLNFVHGRR